MEERMIKYEVSYSPLNTQQVGRGTHTPSSHSQLPSTCWSLSNDCEIFGRVFHSYNSLFVWRTHKKVQDQIVCIFVESVQGGTFVFVRLSDKLLTENSVCPLRVNHLLVRTRERERVTLALLQYVVAEHFRIFHVICRSNFSGFHVMLQKFTFTQMKWCFFFNSIDAFNNMLISALRRKKALLNSTDFHLLIWSSLSPIGCLDQCLPRCINKCSLSWIIEKKRNRILFFLITSSLKVRDNKCSAFGWNVLRDKTFSDFVKNTTKMSFIISLANSIFNG